MRIKEYENWKLSSPQCGNIIRNKPQQQYDIFSISHLLETTRKPTLYQYEHNFLLNNVHIRNNLVNFDHQVQSKKDIRVLNINVKGHQRTEREKDIKSKIKQRIVEEYMNDSFIAGTNRIFFNHDTKRKQDNMTSSFDGGKNDTKEATVYIKGCSLPFNSIYYKKRSKSTVIRSGLKNQKQNSTLHKVQKPKTFLKQLHVKKSSFSVEMKRQNSSNLAKRQKYTPQVRNNVIAKDIEPWDFEEGPQAFQI